MATGTGLVFDGDDESRIAYTLAYNEVSMGSDGQVLTDDKKKKQREKRGYCVECRGPPVLLYTIKKSRMNPLFTTKKPMFVEGLCGNGFCFLCHPEKDPEKDKTKQNKYMRSKMSPVPIGGRRSIPVISSQTLNQVVQRSPLVSPATMNRRTSDPVGSQRRISDPINNRMSPPISAGRKSVPIPQIPRIDINSTHSDDTGDGLDDTKSSSQELEVPARETPPPAAESRNRQYCSDSVLPHMIDMDEPSRPTKNNNNNNNNNYSEMEPSSESLRQSEQRSAEFSVSSRDSPRSNNNNNNHSNRLTSSMRDGGIETSSRSNDHSLRESIRNEEWMDVSDSFNNDAIAEEDSSLPLDAIVRETSSSMRGSSSLRDSSITETITEEDVQVIITELDSLLSELMKVPGAEEIVAQSVVGAMREHKTKEEVLIYCLRTIWESCKDSDKMKREIMNLGTSEDIVNAMMNFSKSAILQEVGCGATWALAIRAENRQAFIRRGSCSIIMAAIDKFRTKENVVCSAVGAARTLSPEDDAREPLRLAEGSKMVAKAMKAHPTSSIIQRDGCAFLSNAAVDMKQNYVTVVSQEELETVLLAMQHHRNDPAVVAGACFALKNYTVDENNCRTLRKISICMELIQHAAGFMASPTCMEDAEDILESMQFAQTLDNSIEDEAYVTFSSTVEQQIMLPGFVNRILEFMEENDWSPRLTSLGLQTYGSLALSDSNQKDRVYNKTNLSRIVQFAKNLKEEQSVCLEACNLFAILAGNESQRPILTAGGVCDLLFHGLTFKHNEALIRSCLQALELLASSNAGNCIAMIKPQKIAIQEAFEANQMSETIMMSTITIMSLLEAR